MALEWSTARVVGSGGMGVVYEAWDRQLERRVALKVLHAHLTADPAHRDRLLQEARMAARVEHPNVVRVYAVHAEDEGLAVEMEFIEGTPLHGLLGGRQMSPSQAADLMRQVLEALAACHEKGVVHGDLKPSNLMVTASGRVVLTDFGIARAILYGEGTATPSVSLSAPIWATPQYCPPEAWDGARPSPAWDLYALGVVMHEALAGCLPFDAQTPAALMRAKLEGRESKVSAARSDISPALATLVDSLMATHPEQRPVSARTALAQLLATPEAKSPPPITQPLEHTPRKTAESRKPAPARTLPGFPGLPGLSPTPPTAELRVGRWLWLGAGCVLGIAIAAGLLWNRAPSKAPATELTTPAVGERGTILDLVTVGSTAYFTYDDGVRGRELWYARPSGEIDLIADINPGEPSSNPSNIRARGTGALFFAATTNTAGREPWIVTRSDSKHTAWMIRDVFPGTGSSNPLPVGAWGETMMFYATTLQAGTELWVSNSKAEQTSLLADLNPKDGSSRPTNPRFLADEEGLWFLASDQYWRLFRYEHATGETKELAHVVEQVGELARVGQKLLFAMLDTQYGNELWVSGLESGTLSLFKDINPGILHGDPQQFFVWKDRLYFQATTQNDGAELWVSDGTEAGTRLLCNIASGAESSYPFGFVATDKLLFFRAKNIASGQEIFVTDGTEAGTRLACDVRAGAEGSTPYSLAVVGKYLFFTAEDGAHGEELWALDIERLGDPTALPHLVEDLWPGPTGAEPHNLSVTSEGKAFFACKLPDGERIYRLEVDETGWHLTPYPKLPLHAGERP